MARGPPAAAAAAAAHGPRLAVVGRALLLVAATATFLPAAESSCPRGAPSPSPPLPGSPFISFSSFLKLPNLPLGLTLPPEIAPAVVLQYFYWI